MNQISPSADAPGYLNGEYTLLNQLTVPVMDRGFLYGDGCYEVIPVYQKKPFLLMEHLKRLLANLEKIQIPFSEDTHPLEMILDKLTGMSPFENEYLYLQITRGTYPQREHSFPKKMIPTVYAYSFPFTPPDFNRISRGIPAITHPDIRWNRCDIKSISLLGNVLLREKANAANAEETLLIRDGFLTEGAISNVFIVKSGQIMTPPLSNAILPGITRATVIKLLRNAHIPVEEKPISEENLRHADEIWVTSSTKEITPVASLDSASLEGPLYNKIWREIFEAYQSLRSKN